MKVNAQRVFTLKCGATAGQAGSITLKKSKGSAYTNVVAQAIHEKMASDPKVCVLTAAMCRAARTKAQEH